MADGHPTMRYGRETLPLSTGLQVVTEAEGGNRLTHLTEKPRQQPTVPDLYLTGEPYAIDLQRVSGSECLKKFSFTPTRKEATTPIGAPAKYD